METVTLTSGGSSKCVIYLFGAHVTSWVDSAGTELIYTSPSAIYNGHKAIRGGIPVCFPQFGPHGPLKQHGFARTSTWALDLDSDHTDTSATFVLSDTANTRASAWPHNFELRLSVSLSPCGNILDIITSVKNLGATHFSFTLALHSYLRCPAESVVLRDYSALKYLDNTAGNAEVTQDGDVTFGKEVDRVYKSTSDVLELSSAHSSLQLLKSNLPEAVVWNPYIEKTAALSDMPDDDWKNFICIEPARIIEPAQVAPGDSWSASLKLTSKQRAL